MLDIKTSKAGKTLHHIKIYINTMYIGDYERSQEGDIDRKKEEIRLSAYLLLEIYQRYGFFIVCWDNKDRKKSIRVHGREVGIIPKKNWQLPNKLH